MLSVLALASVAAWAQNPPRAEFEVASVKPSGPMVNYQVTAGVHIDGAQVRCTSLALKDYIRIAYKVKDYQVSGPDWLGGERFDIAAKIPEGAKPDQVPEMIQRLLEERFQLKIHHDKKDFPVYALVVAKGGLRLKESPLEAEGGEPGKPPVSVTANGGPNGTTVSLGRGSNFSFGNNRLEGKKLTMTQIADVLARFVDRPVLDQSEVKGNYDFALEFTPEDFRAMMIRGALAAGVNLPPEALKALELSSGDSLHAALQVSGLKLETRKAPLDVLVIDSLLKAPTEN